MAGTRRVCVCASLQGVQDLSKVAKRGLSRRPAPQPAGRKVLYLLMQRGCWTRTQEAWAACEASQSYVKRGVYGWIE